MCLIQKAYWFADLLLRHHLHTGWRFNRVLHWNLHQSYCFLSAAASLLTWVLSSSKIIASQQRTKAGSFPQTTKTSRLAIRMNTLVAIVLRISCNTDFLESSSFREINHITHFYRAFSALDFWQDSRTRLTMKRDCAVRTEADQCPFSSTSFQSTQWQSISNNRRIEYFQSTRIRSSSHVWIYVRNAMHGNRSILLQRSERWEWGVLRIQPSVQILKLTEIFNGIGSCFDHMEIGEGIEIF